MANFTKITISLFVLCFPLFINAQSLSEEKAAILKPIYHLFDAMRKADTTGLRSIFDEKARLSTVLVNKEGKTLLKDESIEQLIKAVGTPHTGVWDERLLTTAVRIDGKLANVWADYAFYLDDKFSHCGADVFQLMKKEGQWKIIQLTDTRRKEGCNPDYKSEINQFMDAWHKSAAVADENVYFDSFTKGGIFIGTDEVEIWTKEQMLDLYKKVFERESAWNFKPKMRNIYFSDDNHYAWFDETLDTWMGICRGSGVLEHSENGWKIKHYVLSVAVPNDVVREYIKLLKKK